MAGRRPLVRASGITRELPDADTTLTTPGTVSAPGYSFVGYATTGFYAGSGFFAAGINGSELVRYTVGGMLVVANLTIVASQQDANTAARGYPGSLASVGFRGDMGANCGATFAGYREPSGAGAIIYTGNGGAFAEALRIDQSKAVRPAADNAQTLGTAALRWSTVYAATDTISTSDARLKTPVLPLDAREIAAATDLAREIGTFQYLAAVADKGPTRARRHAGLTVQRAIAVMQAHGLDPLQYAFICFDAWPATPEVPATAAQPEERNEDGELIRPASAAYAGSPARPAGDCYSFRADELLLFLARGFDARLAALEARAAPFRQPGDLPMAASPAPSADARPSQLVAQMTAGWLA